MTNDQFSKVDEAASFIRQRWQTPPRAGIILGSGLGGLAEEIAADDVIDDVDIPHFPQPTAVGHEGRLICGSLAGVSVAALEGRCHLYEGYSVDDIALPVRVMKRLGVDLLVISNAGGGVNPIFKPGDVMVVEDHINLMHRRPTFTFNSEAIPPDRDKRPFPKTPYDASLIESALQIARRHDFAAHVGVYVAVTGPNYETRAEYRCFRRIGGDVVGMSTVPEALAAASCGMQVLALSIVTNVAKPDVLEATNHHKVVNVAGQAAWKLRTIVSETLIQRFNSNDT